MSDNNYCHIFRHLLDYDWSARDRQILMSITWPRERQISMFFSWAYIHAESNVDENYNSNNGATFQFP